MIEPSGNSSSRSLNTATSASELASKANSTGFCLPRSPQDAPPQAVEVAPLAREVASERSGAFFGRVEPTAVDADVVADGHWQGVHHVALMRVVLLERFGQQIKERFPEVGLYGVQPTVEATLGDRLGYVAVLVEERATRLDVAREEGRGHQGYGHHLGA